jgi:hypothetical protein
MTTPWQELTLCGGWAKAQIPRSIEHGVDAPSATPSVSLSTSKIRIAVVQHGGSSRVEVAALSTDGSLLVGVQEGRPLHSWFRGPFGEQWEYTLLVRYHPAYRAVIRASAARKVPGSRRFQHGSDECAPGRYRTLFVEWTYRLLARFHPVLRKVIATYASRVAQVPPPERHR